MPDETKEILVSCRVFIVVAMSAEQPNLCSTQSDASCSYETARLCSLIASACDDMLGETGSPSFGQISVGHKFILSLSHTHTHNVCVAIPKTMTG